MQTTNKRTFLKAACLHCTGIAGVLTSVGALGQDRASAASASISELAGRRLERPTLETEEGGLWDSMDRAESRLRKSPMRVPDKALTAYLQELVCRIGGEHCTDIRVHVVRTPLFNATMAPNGMVQIWTGLLLRVENEAQLAAIVGHELGHYLQRHSLERLQTIKSRAAFAQFMGAFGLVGAIGQLGALASMYSFSRDQELSADRVGMHLMQAAGYDGGQAPQVWTNLLNELKVTGGEDAGKRSPLFATHPAVDTRRSELQALIKQGPNKLGETEYNAAIAPHRLDWMQDEIKRGQFEESLAIFDRMLAKNPSDVQATYSRGEVYRLRGGPGDVERALRDLTIAAEAPTCPPEAFRGLGLVQRQRMDAGSAQAAFQKYLVASPEAADASLVKSYLADLQP